MKILSEISYTYSILIHTFLFFLLFIIFTQRLFIYNNTLSRTSQFKYSFEKEQRRNHGLTTLVAFTVSLRSLL